MTQKTTAKKRITAKKAIGIKKTSVKKSVKKTPVKRLKKSSIQPVVVITENTNYPCIIKTKSGKQIAVLGTRLSASHTMNLGDFNSVKFDVGVSLAPMGEGITPKEMNETGWNLIMVELGAKIRSVREKKEKEKKGNG